MRYHKYGYYLKMEVVVEMEAPFSSILLDDYVSAVNEIQHMKGRSIIGEIGRSAT